MHQLYYFPNDRKYALFTLIYRYKPTKIAPFPCFAMVNPLSKGTPG